MEIGEYKIHSLENLNTISHHFITLVQSKRKIHITGHKKCSRLKTRCSCMDMMTSLWILQSDFKVTGEKKSLICNMCPSPLFSPLSFINFILLTLPFLLCFNFPLLYFLKHSALLTGFLTSLYLLWGRKESLKGNIVLLIK